MECCASQMNRKWCLIKALCKCCWLSWRKVIDGAGLLLLGLWHLETQPYCLLHAWIPKTFCRVSMITIFQAIKTALNISLEFCYNPINLDPYYSDESASPEISIGWKKKTSNAQKCTYLPVQKSFLFCTKELCKYPSDFGLSAGIT